MDTVLKGIADAVQGGVHHRQDDVKDYAKLGMIGSVCAIAYGFIQKNARRNIDLAGELVDETTLIHSDRVICTSFIELQNYRELNEYLFRSALQNVDQLLVIENALVSGRSNPLPTDVSLSWSYFRVAVRRLRIFQELVKEKLGKQHALVVNTLINKVYGQMQKHFLNVMHICHKFRPEHLIARAKKDVENVLRSEKFASQEPTTNMLLNRFKNGGEGTRYTGDTL